jgi:hypothetical protein
MQSSVRNILDSLSSKIEQSQQCLFALQQNNADPTLGFMVSLENQKVNDLHNLK